MSSVRIGLSFLGNDVLGDRSSDDLHIPTDVLSGLTWCVCYLLITEFSALNY